MRATRGPPVVGSQERIPHDARGGRAFQRRDVPSTSRGTISTRNGQLNTSVGSGATATAIVPSFAAFTNQTFGKREALVIARLRGHPRGHGGELAQRAADTRGATRTSAGEKNAYWCEDYRGYIVTIGDARGNCPSHLRHTCCSRGGRQGVSPTRRDRISGLSSSVARPRSASRAPASRTRLTIASLVRSATATCSGSKPMLTSTMQRSNVRASLRARQRAGDA